MLCKVLNPEIALLRRQVLFLLFLLPFSSSNGQEKSRTILTDSSTIKIWCKEGSYKIVEERFKNKDLRRTISYFKDTSTIWNDLSENSIGYTGIQKIYNENGNLILFIDHDKREWTPLDKTEFPHFKKLITAKEKADAILKNLYGDTFFKRNLKWKIFNSSYFSDDAPEFGIEWTRNDDAKKYRPDKFLLSYELNSQIPATTSIQLLIDINGNLLVSIPGFRKKPIYNCGLEQNQKYNSDFQLTTKQAIDLAKKYGLVENDSTEISVSLVWEDFEDSLPKIFNGHFRIYVTQQIERRFIKQDFSGSIYYTVWVINPWTNEFIERKELCYDYTSPIKFFD